MREAGLYLFADVLGALAKVHDIPPEGIKALRARIQNYQKFNIVPFSPGKGYRIKYTKDDVYKWAFCLEFADFGIDPRITSDLVTRWWEKVKTGFYHDKDKDYYIHFRPSMLADPEPAFLTAKNLNLIVCQEESLRLFFRKNKDSANVSDRTIREFRTRHGTINVSHVRRQVDEALGKLGSEE